MRHEIELRLDARGELRAGDDLRHMAMAQRAIGVKIAVPMRMMRALDGLAAGAGAAGDAGDEQTRVGEPQRQQRHDGEQRRGREASGMRDMRRRRLLQMLRHGTGELANPRRRAVRVLVHRLVGGWAGVAKVGGDVHAMHPRARRCRGRQQPVDDGGGDAVRRGGKQGRDRRAPNDGLDHRVAENFRSG